MKSKGIRSVRELWLMSLVDVRMGLLLQNARQILDIIRGTFPGLSFSEDETLDNCTLAHTAGETLNCLWSDAVRIINAPGQIQTAAAMHALIRVSNRAGLYQFDC